MFEKKCLVKLSLASIFIDTRARNVMVCVPLLLVAAAVIAQGMDTGPLWPKFVKRE